MHVFLYNFMDYRKFVGFIYAWLQYGTNRWGGDAWYQVRADLSCNERSELAKGMLRAKTGMGRHP